MSQEMVEDRLAHQWGLLEHEVKTLKNVYSCPTEFNYPDLVTVLTPSCPIIKPRDIPQLDLDQLQGVEAAARLQMFFDLIEKCSDEDETRVQVAKGRVSSELAILIHNNQSKRRCKTWLELKDFLKIEFAVDVNLDRAWQKIDAAGYDWEESPQAFTNRFICQYAILETRFPREKFPSRDKSIKRNLWHGLPQESNERLEGFLDEDYPLNKFIDRVEHERQLLEARHTPTLNRVKGAKDREAPQTTKREELGVGRQHDTPKELGVKPESNEVNTETSD